MFAEVTRAHSSRYSEGFGGCSRLDESHGRSGEGGWFESCNAPELSLISIGTGEETRLWTSNATRTADYSTAGSFVEWDVIQFEIKRTICWGWRLWCACSRNLSVWPLNHSRGMASKLLNAVVKFNLDCKSLFKKQLKMIPKGWVRYVDCPSSPLPHSCKPDRWITSLEWLDS